MPYKIIVDGDKHCVVKVSDGKKMGCHPSRAEAQKQMAALHVNEAMSEALWVDPFAYVEGQPFRIFPIGTFKRGERTIELTAERLQRIEQNYNTGNHPRWKVPIYFGHPTDAEADPPKVGNAVRLEYRDGDGLYAYPEFTDDGKKAVQDGAYQYVSPGIIWAGYTDQSGKEISDVLDHIALTNRPWFGSQTAIFSSDANLMKGDDTMEENKLSELFNMFRALFADAMMKCPECKAQMKKEGKCPECGHEDKPDDMAAHSDKDMPPDEMLKKKKMKEMEKQHMADTPVINIDEFNALKAQVEGFAAIKAQAEEAKQKAEEFAVKLEAEKLRADTLAEQFSAERKTRAIGELRMRAEKFAVALPEVKADEYAEKLYTLREKDANLAAWFMAKLDAANRLLAQSQVFSQISRSDAPAGDETIETLAARILTEKFSNASAKYPQALSEAGQQRPDLARAHLGLGR